MNSQKIIKERLKKKDNDYSKFEPFCDSTPIPSSIIIPVYNNAKAFKLTLESLSLNPSIRKHSELFEFIIVDDGSKEKINSIVEDSKVSCRLKYKILEKNSGRSVARNRGIYLASNNLFFFFDSDIILPYNYFEEMWKIHNATTNAVAMGLAENVFLDEEIKLQEIKTGKFMPNIQDDFRYHKKFKKGKFNRDEYHLVQETDWFKQFGHYGKIGPFTLPKMVVAHNISVPKKFVDAIKGFDERFRTWGYEDVYFGAKLVAKGCYVIPSKTTGVYRICNRSKKFTDANRQIYERLIESENI